ncbi:MAG: nucleoside-diphosphate kinase [Deltaproteobacteria bacterium]|nr:nucleoside-diphosphate kinase [Deltaproteobacteria bacterium]MDZ4224363.1 nucleoside-diphosphate kinase [bacterium]
MALEKTLAIIKPDALEKGIIGELCKRVEDAGLKIVGMKMMQLTPKKAEGFYAVHQGKPFFAALVKYMSSGPCVVMCLEGENAIKRWRDTMGATDPEKAAEGTIRKDFGTNIERNVTHGSDAADTARSEIGYFFESGDLMHYEWI